MNKTNLTRPGATNPKNVRKIFYVIAGPKLAGALKKIGDWALEIVRRNDKADEVIAKLKGMRLSKAAQLVEETVDETVVYYAFPDEHWRRIHTNNPLERLMREIRRRTRAVGAFPDGESALNLAAARLRHIAGTKWSAKRYLNMKLLKEKTMIA